MSILDNFKNPWANNEENNIANTDYDTIGEINSLAASALKTDLFEGNDEVLGREGMQKSNFNPTAIKLPKTLFSFNSPVNPYHGGDDYFWAKDPWYYPDGDEGELLRNRVEEQKVKWKKQLQKEGQVIDDVIIEDLFLFYQLAIALGLSGLVDDSFNIITSSKSFLDSESYEFTNAAFSVVERFMQNSRSDTEVPEIIRAEIEKNAQTENLKQMLINFIEKTLVVNHGDFSKIENSVFHKSTDILKDDGKNLRNLPYYHFDDKTRLSLNAIVGGIQGVKLILKTLSISDKIELPTVNTLPPYNSAKLVIQENGTFYYSANFDLILFDDFGINANDITDPKSGLVKKYGMPALIAFWMLHAQRGYKPFTHTITINFNHIFKVHK